MANGNGIGAYTGKICVSLIVAMILSGVGLAIAQRGTDTQVETNRQILQSHSIEVHKIPVIENEIQNIRRENDAAHTRIEKRMDKNKSEILDAIRERN
jgi:hypothetical protein